MNNCWQHLGIEATPDKRDIKRAYAVLLKQHRPDDDAVAYQFLREAYEQALVLADYIEQQQLQEDDEQFEMWREQQDEDLEEIDDNNITIGDEATVDVSSSPADLDNNDTVILDTVSHEQTRLIDEQQLIDQQQNVETEISLNQWEAGLKLIYQQLLNKNQLEAIEILDYIQQNNMLESLDDQYEFEGGLLICIYQQDYLPYEFIIKALKLYDWKQNENPFAYDYPYNYAYNAVNSQLLVEMSRRDIIENYYQGKRQMENKVVEQILFSPFDEEAMEEIYDSRIKLNIASKIFSYVQKHHKNTDKGAIPQETMQWWLKWINSPTHDQKKSKQKKVRGLFFGWFFILVFLLIQGIIAISDGNKRRSSQKHLTHNRDYQVLIEKIKRNREINNNFAFTEANDKTLVGDVNSTVNKQLLVVAK